MTSIKATMLARHGALFEVEFNDERPVLEILTDRPYAAAALY